MNGLYRNLRSVAGPEQTVKMQSAVKKDLLQFYTHIIENNADDHRFAYEVAESCFFMGKLSSYDDPVQFELFLKARALMGNLSSYDDPVQFELFLKAQALYEHAARDSPEDTSALGALANTLLFLGQRAQDWGQYEQAEAAFRRSLGSCSNAWPGSTPITPMTGTRSAIWVAGVSAECFASRGDRVRRKHSTAASWPCSNGPNST